MYRFIIKFEALIADWIVQNKTTAVANMAF
jgi:hypothetical protein